MQDKWPLKLVIILTFFGGAALFLANQCHSVSASHDTLAKQKGRELPLETLLKQMVPGQEEAWLRLLTVTNILDKLPKEESPTVVLDRLNQLLQEFWLRKAGSERWQLTDDTLTALQKKSIAEAFTELGLYQEIAPTQEGGQFKQYDCAFLMGALASRMESRLRYLMKLWEQGVRFDRLYVLVGYRKLSPDQEPITKTLEGLGIDLNETNMATYLVPHILQEIGGFPGVEIIYVNTPINGKAQRATCTDTITTWKNQYGLGGQLSTRDRHILVVSNQPYVEYQASVARRILSDNFRERIQMIGHHNTHFQIGNGYTIEAVGHSGVHHKLTVGLDSLARIVYESHPLWKKQMVDFQQDKLIKYP